MIRNPKFPSFLCPFGISILKTKTWKHILFQELKCSAFNQAFTDWKEDGEIKKAVVIYPATHKHLFILKSTGVGSAENRVHRSLL